ncbi:hypothetical protein J1N35_041323 [Gossypium stocksii]|uniref:Uncharacterized protein n=1 Tax=Gossypium stocksii TaxID=47602 RepID=A0A9D3ZIK1_9ROSI|nr:hypothetical protein J1N35_041323 [Gossypium stocksii]
MEYIPWFRLADKPHLLLVEDEPESTTKEGDGDEDEGGDENEDEGRYEDEYGGRGEDIDDYHDQDGELTPQVIRRNPIRNYQPLPCDTRSAQ